MAFFEMGSGGGSAGDPIHITFTANTAPKITLGFKPKVFILFISSDANIDNWQLYCNYAEEAFSTKYINSARNISPGVAPTALYNLGVGYNGGTSYYGLKSIDDDGVTLLNVAEMINGWYIAI